MRGAGVEIVTLGQYLRPTAAHAPVARYVEPAEFDGWAISARRMGFSHVASGPLVRTSYRAADALGRSSPP
jgi:lipoic acid synthetase